MIFRPNLNDYYEMAIVSRIYYLPHLSPQKLYSVLKNYQYSNMIYALYHDVIGRTVHF